MHMHVGDVHILSLVLAGHGSVLPHHIPSAVSPHVSYLPLPRPNLLWAKGEEGQKDSTTRSLSDLIFRVDEQDGCPKGWK